MGKKGKEKAREQNINPLPAGSFDRTKQGGGRKKKKKGKGGGRNKVCVGGEGREGGKGSS